MEQAKLICYLDPAYMPPISNTYLFPKMKNLKRFIFKYRIQQK